MCEQGSEKGAMRLRADGRDALGDKRRDAGQRGEIAWKSMIRMKRRRAMHLRAAGKSRSRSSDAGTRNGAIRLGTSAAMRVNAGGRDAPWARKKRRRHPVACAPRIFMQNFNSTHMPIFRRFPWKIPISKKRYPQFHSKLWMFSCNHLHEYAQNAFHPLILPGRSHTLASPPYTSTIM